MNKQQRGIAIIIGILIVLLVIILLIARPNKNMQPLDGADVATEIDAVDTEEQRSIATAGSAKPRVLSRAEALIEYQEHVIRVTDACTGEKTTHSFSVPTGTRFMIDNDSDVTHTVIAEGRRVVLGAHKYTTEAIDVMGVVESICDPKTGVTTISVKES